MADMKQVMLDEVRKNSRIQTSYVAETEELIDTGLAKNEDNIMAAALAYLDEKGYRRRADNVEMAKQMIMEVSEGYDTVIVKKRKVEETDLFEKASINELRDAINVSILDTVTSLDSKLDRIVNKAFEYRVEELTTILTEKDRPHGHLAGDFESFEELLNRYGSAGWELDKIYREPKVSSVVPHTFIVFRREIMN
jgi:hypothetical protein